MVSDLAGYGAPSELVEEWKKHVSDLTDVQERAVRAGVLAGSRNLLVVAPTSSGKTFVGEMAATVSAYGRRQHAIFVVPFRALADEHYDLFRERYSDLLSVVISTSDWTEFDADIRAGNFNLAVMTYEKLMSFMAQQSDLIGRCTALVVDEVQTLSESARGAKLEMMLTQVMLAANPPQIIALSASLDDINGLDSWLKATLVSSAERPIPLTQSVCAPSGTAVELAAGGTTVVRQLTNAQPDRDELITALTLRFLAEGKQVVIFRSTVRNVHETARHLRVRLPAVGTSHSVSERLNDMEDSDALNELRLCLASGVGFHDADLSHPERKLVEDGFRSGEVRALVATTTLAMGVNLPCDVVIVADTTRPKPAKIGWGRTNISVSEYRNAAGRAGRLGQRTAGHAVLLAEHDVEQRQLVNGYLLGRVEPIKSQIPARPFDDVIFEIVCAGVADTEEGIVQFIANTFAYPTFYERAGGGHAGVRGAIAAAVAQCVEGGLVVRDGLQLHPTQLARVLGGAGLSLASAARLASAIEQAAVVDPSTSDLIFDVASCVELGDRPWPRRVRGTEMDPRPSHAPSGSDCSARSRLAATLSRPAISADERKALVRARCLLDWMGGLKQRSISALFEGMGAAPTRVRHLGKNAAWLLDTVAEAADVYGAPTAFIDKVRTLTLEARYGLPGPLAPLARLRVPGISREHLQHLYANGRDRRLHEPEVVLDAPDDEFDGLLTSMQLGRLRQAILTDIEESLKRKRAGHVARADQIGLSRKIVEELYTTKGGGLEQAVTDALNHVGVSATRVLRQPTGEEDVRVAHADGTVIISVTASQDDARPIRWNKAKEILGAGTGLNPINYVCVGRPGFESLAEQRAADIGRETGTRSILLVPIPVLAEAVVAVAEGNFAAEALGNLLARQSGILTTGDVRNPVAEGH